MQNLSDINFVDLDEVFLNQEEQIYVLNRALGFEKEKLSEFYNFTQEMMS